MKFLPLLELRLQHDYYTDGRCPDFRIEPTAATQKLLNSHRGVLKTLPDGIRILMAAADDNTQFVPLSKDAIFAFNLRLHNPDFALFTDLTEITQTVAPIYTDAGLTSTDPAELTLMGRSKTEYFVVPEAHEGARFALDGQPLPLLLPLPLQQPSAFYVRIGEGVFRVGVRPLEFSISDQVAATGNDRKEGLREEFIVPKAEWDGVISKQFHYDEATKVMTLDSRAASEGKFMSICYPIAPAQESGVLAGAEIHCNDFVRQNGAPPKDDPIARACVIHFKAKKVRWKYYVITDQKNAQFEIRDSTATDSAAVLDFSNSTNLTDKTDPTDVTATALSAQYPNQQLWRFVSKDPVPCRQAARTGLQLWVGGNKVGGPLPNPALSNYALEEPRSETVSLVQVVKHFTH